jgi:hypothetical protein
MKLVAYLLIAAALALILFIAFTFFKQKTRVLSPIPNQDDVRVTIITPTR